MVETLNLWLALGLGTGLSPIAPGTVGSLLGVPVAWWLLGRPLSRQAWVIALLLVLAVPVCHFASLQFAGSDHGGIVADEIVAFPLAVIGLRALRHPLGMALAFAVYRVFDGLKPPPIHLAERVSGGFGIVLDDTVAAIATWLVVAAGLFVWQRYRARGSGAI
ncbi:phosphatidylglycerophosphatase A family protein [Vreelandella massiliensis]|uniref:phosphatidylglycerophosphatase A family protein n=1 Tax=Vreelandella massiliensis TaxID=1816686 RepID=UPI00096A296E|nr:phosphatidylglycerophosphatase A [Halomonas massiliensis]MYL23191.1 phosphatidylglycerophosphatase A [Halomonas alkaliantarctica]